MTLERGNDILAAAEWRQELIDTAIPFAVAVLLGLVLLYVRYRSRSGAAHQLLFGGRPVDEARARWLARRAASARQREQEREREHEHGHAERAVRAEAAKAEAAARTVLRPALPAALPLGPPTLRFRGRFGSALAASTLLCLFMLPSWLHGGPDPNGLAWIVLVVYVLITVAFTLGVSLVCAWLVTVIPRRNVAISMACGVVAFVPFAAKGLVPPQFVASSVGVLLGIGALTGLAVGLAEHASRKAVDDELVQTVAS